MGRSSFFNRMDGGRSFEPDGEKAERGHGRFPALGQEWLALEGGQRIKLVVQ